MDLSNVKGCVSFSLYGSGSKYAVGMLENVPLVKSYYPGWVCRIYISRGHYATQALREAGAEVIEMDPREGSGGMFWRFFAADDPAFTHVIVRDADSRVNPREVACVEEWISSGKTLHVMWDHPAHTRRSILGGAWGIKPGAVDFRRWEARWKHTNTYGDDEKFLEDRVWPKFAATGDYLRHSFEVGPGSVPFPPHETYSGFVCEPLKFTVPMTGKVGAFVLSPEKFHRRRERFFNRLSESASYLAGKVDWWPGADAASLSIPEGFPHRETYPHYYAATVDHLRILQHGQDADLDYLFILEDDSVIDPEFDDYLSRTLLCVPKDWWAIQLGGQSWTNGNRDWFRESGEVAFGDALARVRGCCGMHGVLWSRQGIEAALKFYGPEPHGTIDWEFMLWQKECEMFYAPSKWIVSIDPEATQWGRDS